jgi:hypothetical protein
MRGATYPVGAALGLFWCAGLGRQPSARLGVRRYAVGAWVPAFGAALGFLGTMLNTVDEPGAQAPPRHPGLFAALGFRCLVFGAALGFLGTMFNSVDEPGAQAPPRHPGLFAAIGFWRGAWPSWNDVQLG